MTTPTLREGPSGPGPVQLDSSSIVNVSDVVGASVTEALDNLSGIVGPTGPAGPTGATGATGATGPALGAVVDVTWSGTVDNVDILALGVTNGGVLRANVTAPTIITGFLASGIVGEFEFTLEHISTNAQTISFRNLNVGSSAGSRLSVPGPPTGAPPDFVIYPASGVKFRLLPLAAPSIDRAWFMTAVARVTLVSPSELAAEASTLAVPFIIRTPYTAGAAGTADDVAIAAPAFLWRIIDCWSYISTAIVASTGQLRTSTGGGGGARSSSMSTATTGQVRNNDTQSYTFSASSPLFWRRSDRGIAGEVFIMGIRF